MQDANADRRDRFLKGRRLIRRNLTVPKPRKLPSYFLAT
jgi:hypothetical protein